MQLGAFVATVACVAAASVPRQATAEAQAPDVAAALPSGSDAAVELATSEHVGRPVVKLDRLVFPEHVAHAAAYVSHLKRALRRAAARADWGAGRGARIEYRFIVTDLTLTHGGNVLTVSCTAVGKLPKGKMARSRIRFGGDPRKPRQVVSRVLEIVARGVITRLAELERARRAGE